MQRYFTNSELSTARRCLRKWYFSNYLQIYPRYDRVNDTVLIGILCHDALEAKYGQNQDPLAQLVYTVENMVLEQEALVVKGINDEKLAIIERNIDTIREAADFSRIILEGYMQWLEEEGPDSHLTLVSAEEEAVVLMPTDFGTDKSVLLLAKLDARFHNQMNNARVFMDHKTVQNFSDREKWAHLDTQFRFYALIEYLRLLEEGANPIEGTWTDGGILNMLRKVKRTSRSTPPYYKRKEVRHSLIELRNFFQRTTGEIARILQLEEALDSGVEHMTICPPTPTRDCAWDCPYMTLCAFTDDGSDAKGYIEAVYITRDPLERYKSVGGLRVV